MTPQNGPQLAPAYHKVSTYKTLLYTFFSVTLAGVICAFALSSYLKKQTIEELAASQAEQQAEIIFKALWQGMMQGWEKEQMDHFIHSIELGAQQKQVQLVRSKLIEDQFGVSDASKERIQADPLLAQVMTSGETHISQGEGQLRYLYAIKATEGCLACHSNSFPGAIHGVIDLRFSDQPMQAPLTQTFNLYIATLLLVVVLLCSTLFFILRLRIVRPLRRLSREIRDAIKDDLSVNRIDTEQFQLREPFQLAQSFNQLAQELDDYHEQLREHSYSDALTGLYNRRYFNKKMPDLLRKSRRSEQPLTLMLIDLDRFKAINDTYGHEAGDMALVHFSGVLKHGVKPDDLVIRLGGDEFVVVLTKTDISGALAIKRRLADALNETRANLGVVNLHLEASVGYATYPIDATTTDALLLQADQAMYHEKKIRKAAREKLSTQVADTA